MADDGRMGGYVSQEEYPYGREQQGTCEHDEAGVAEGEFEANTQTGSSSQGLFPHARSPMECL
jgi:hypothetical protein